MTLVGTALNLGEKMKIYPQVLTFFIKPQICLFHFVILQTTSKKWTKVKNARAGRAKLVFLSRHVFETRTATGREIFACQDSGVSQTFILIISNGEKNLVM